MRPLTVEEPELVCFALQDEIRRSSDARYDHRLHALLLVTQGMTCPKVAKLMGDSVKTVQLWVKRFNERGFAGLVDKDRPGRPPRLTGRQLATIDAMLRDDPRKAGIEANLWDGKTLSLFIRQRFGVELRVRQSLRLFHKLGFRYRKPRPALAGADLLAQAEFKKTRENREESRG